MHHRAAEARAEREWQRDMAAILQAEHLARCKRLPKLDELTGKAKARRKKLLADPDKPPMTREDKAAAWAVEMARMQAFAGEEKGRGRE